MADAAPLDIPLECVSSQTAKCQEESTSGQTHDIGSESGFSEPTKQKIGCDVLQNELQEICNASNDDDQSQSFGNLTEKSHPEQLGLPPEAVSNISQGAAVNILTKSAHGHPSTCENIQNGPLQIRTALSSCTTSDHLQSFSGNVTKNSLAEKLELPCEEPHEDLGCQTGKTSCSEQISLEQRNDFGFGTREEKQHIGSDIVQNEIIQTIIPVSSCGNEQLQFISETVNTTFPNEQVGVPPEDVSKTLEPTNNFGFETQSSELAEDKQHCGSDVPQNEGLQSCDGNEPLQSFCENMNTSSLNEQAVLPCEGVKKTLEQTNNVNSGTSYSEPAEENQNLGSDFVQDEPLQTIIPVASCGGNEQLQVVNEVASVTSLSEQVGLPLEAVSKTCQTEKLSCYLQTASDQINESGSGSVPCEPQEQRDQLGLLPSQNDQVKTCTAVSSSIVSEQSGPSVEEMKNSVIGHLEPPLEDASKDHTDELIKPHMNNVPQNSSLDPSETASENASKISSQIGCKDKRNSSSRQKSRSLVSSDRVLRSRTVEKPEAPELSNNVATLESSNSVANVSNEKEGKRQKRKKKHRERVAADEFSRIRSHLRYFLNRINYEKSLIDAYSGEGWKGNSLEKIRPEKELQRATSEILRRKLKIRDLFQRLDSLCAEGMFPESLFDSDGQIDSEDIFCAKCGSKDVYADNDIILCDGACDRGFHQYCLEPPLLSEEIPPDDEGWLCPGCDCKVDCIDLLNDSQGTDLSITDSWEKVFPEAAVAASAGQHQENNQGLLSDDSDDNDYDPDGPETDEEVQEAESSSDESEYASASDGLETPKTNDEQYLGLPSDDSEDDDFNPDAPDPTEDVKQDSSSSDFTSDSEDLEAVLDEDNKSFENGEGPQSSLLEGSMLLRGSGEKSSKRGQKRHSIKDEISSLLESDPGQDGSTPVSGKRHVERLDYKKLHDEEYGNIPTSDDEDYNETAAPRKRKKGTGQVSPASLKGKPSTIKNGVTSKDIKDDPDKNEHTPRRTPRRKSSAKDNSSSPNESLKSSPKSGSTSGRARASKYKRLGEAVTQQLYASFKENQYPDRSMKERLAQELGVMAKQVSKWFENARHCVKAGLAVPQAMRKQPNQAETNIRDADHDGTQKNESPRTDDAVAGCCSQDVKDNKSATPKSSRAKTSTPKGRKRKSRLDPGGSDLDEKFKTPPETSSKGGRVTRRRKSVA
ncbi:putative transcription factor Homobox-WOX family [Rosa chinensis]|uniref:Putative transcription factor Homobox-WOX family n=1 Tax=Rosa chinensis TaxID=74649 RepID=A0A2P6PLL0_ROSCH|nr:homeobox protein HAT3.1 [Rosa chinensis]XP_024163055.1 homeobox protein HAT3.1 [Rosa chinensis]PRQ22821.1 putative transcription factor Homobox-WOX family [Rosa chinensis]